MAVKFKRINSSLTVSSCLRSTRQKSESYVEKMHEVPAITTSSPGYSGFNIPSVGALDPLRGIVGNVAQIRELSKKKKDA
ncbi:unnamed protein product [Brassica oleracea]